MKFNRILIVNCFLFTISSSAQPMQWFLGFFKSKEQTQAEQQKKAQLQLQQAVQQEQQTENDLKTRIATLKKEISDHRNEVQRLLQASQASKGSSLTSFQLNRDAAKQQLSLQHLKEKYLRSTERMLRTLQNKSRCLEQSNPKKRKRDAERSLSGKVATTTSSSLSSSVQSSEDTAEADKVICASNKLIHQMMPQLKKMKQETDEKYNEAMQQYHEACAKVEAHNDALSAVLNAHLPHVDDQEVKDIYKELNVPQTTSTSSSSASTESREQTIINVLIRKNFSANNATVAAPMVAAYEDFTGKILATDEEIVEVALDFLK